MLALAGTLRGAEPAAGPKEGDHPPLKGVTPVDDPAEAARRLAVAPGLRADLWAAEPDLENPVSFSFDDGGRCFVAETFRRRSSSLDIRAHQPWLLDSLAMRSVSDRLAFLQKAFADPKTLPFLGLVDRNGDGRLDWRDLAVESERLRLLEDRDGDGRADHSSVFAEGFNTAVTGLGAGVLAHGGDLFFTCLPDLWRLPADGAPRREALLSGFGVHITYSGHDLHGLIFGPDGKLYWTIGDSGARVTTKEGRVVDVADTGAVFRANPDGTECEVVMRGLRNPEELCFNDLGDLFTADNNADGGDLSRWVQVVEGGDAGWQIGWQGLPGLGAWISEKLWRPEAAQTALAQLPPLGTIGHGPAGIAYYPGTGLPEAWREHFFVCDFPGGVRTFQLHPHGASYTLDAPPHALNDNGYVLENKLAWGFYPTDVDFSVNGGIYLLDWVRDVEKPGKGRIFRLHDPATDAGALVEDTRRLLAAGMAGRDAAELSSLLGHADRRVRLAAQFALAQRRDITALTRVASGAGPRLARLHALWGLGQLGRMTPEALNSAIALIADADEEVRAQSAKMLGDARIAEAAPALIAALADPAPRVRFFAALALGKLRTPAAGPGLLTMLRENTPGDAFLRHAGVMGLAGCAGAPTLLAAAEDPSPAVRAGVLLALRRLAHPEVARFLRDSDPQLVLEAARAIYDTPIEAAMPQLGALTAQPDLPAPVALRAINACYHIGDSAAAGQLAALADRHGASEELRVEAVEALGQWNQALGRDRFLGLWRPLPVSRDSRAASTALVRVVSSLLARSAGDRVRFATVTAVAFLKIQEAEIAMASIAGDPKASGALRAAALQTLAANSSSRTAAVLQAALSDADPALRARALELEARLRPDNAVEAASSALKTGSLAEKQNALRMLAVIDSKAADKLIGKWLDRYLVGDVPAALHLDLFEAAAQRGTPDLKGKLAGISVARAQGRLGPWRECLTGGDATRGRQIFCEKAEAGCLRCHKVRGLGGEVGPDLSAIGAARDRVAILKSIVFPNADLAPGFENVVLTLKNGQQLVGVVSAEDAASVTVRSHTDGTSATVAKTEVAQRSRLPSPMPEGLGAVLGKRDLRDVVEFLSGLKLTLELR
ncbi:MAG: quinoprotein glucose dehydrogenase [Chthoniobacter sp.]|jgi:quinoprotein glucose dehydrogenase|nr:quinoprotein glucose dehydrogenase [Chthoniobacter sp.]